MVEAAPRSGSLITARLAAEAGREVMAIPGSPARPRAQGCNQLIRDGATLVQNAGDVIEVLKSLRNRPCGRAAGALAPPDSDTDEGEREAIVGLLGPSAVGVDELVRQSGASPAQVQLVLLELDLAGRLERHAGGRVSLAGLSVSAPRRQPL